MHQAIPYRTYLPSSTTGSHRLPSSTADSASSVRSMVSENAVIVFGKRGCCMCHVVRRLLLGLGVNPPVFEVDENDEAGVVEELSRITGGEEVQFPAVFVGGKLFGGLERVMSTHISGELVPILKEAKALWL